MRKIDAIVPSIMLHTVYSNSYDVLKAILVFQVLKDMHERAKKRLGDTEARWLRRVFEASEVIVPSRAVEIDVHRSLCRNGKGVSMTVKTSTSLNWETTLTHLQGARSRNVDQLVWEIYARLTPDGLLGSVSCLKDFIGHCASHPIHRYDAARYLAGLFTKYLAYRTDWLYLWENHEETSEALRPFLADEAASWQMWLWKDIGQRAETFGRFEMSASRLFSNYKALCEHDEQGDAPPLYLFMPAQFPSIMPPFIAQLAAKRDLWVFVNNPCLTDWFTPADHSACGAVQSYLDTNAGVLRSLVLRLFTLGQTDRAPEANPQAFFEAITYDDVTARDKDLRYWKALWSDYHKRGKKEGLRGESGEPPEHTSVFRLDRSQGALGEYTINDSMFFDREEIEEYLKVSRSSDTLLSALQQAICENDDDLLPTQVSSSDNSIRLIQAPDETRELEALVDTLDDLLQTYTADDILVAFPDVSKKASLIEGVFAKRNADKRRRPIPIRIEGAPLMQSNLASQALLGLGHLMLGRCTVDQFEAWLELPVVREALSLSLEDLSLARDWLVRAGFSMGLSKAHCTALGFEHDDEASLEDALLRLSLGWAVDSEAASLIACKDAQGQPTRYLPIDSVGDRDFDSVEAKPDLLFKLTRLFRTLEDIRLETNAEARSIAQWAQSALRWFDTLFAAVDVDTVARSRSVLVAAASVEMIEPVGFELFWHVLETRFTEEKSGGAQRQAVTFASICDVHAMSHKVVIAAGFSEKAHFPGNQVYGEFDLMNAAAHPELPHNRRRLDRDSRIDNRNAFFELMLCATERFLMSYSVGSRPGHDEAPSVVVKEFLGLLFARARMLDAQDGGERQARMRDAITRRVPLSPVSIALFSDSLHVVRSFDVGLAETLVSLGGSKRLPDGRFMDAPFQKRNDSGVDSLHIDPLTLATFLHDPDAWLLKESGLRTLWEENELRPRLVEDQDPRALYAARKRAFERLSEHFDSIPVEKLRDVSDARLDLILETMRADPVNGLRSYREGAVLPEGVWPSYVRYREGCAGGVIRTFTGCLDLNPANVSAKTVTLLAQEIPIYRSAQGQDRAVFLSHSHRDWLYAALMGLLFRAVPEGEGIGLLVVSSENPDSEINILADISAEDAKRLLLGALSVYAETNRSVPGLPACVLPTVGGAWNSKKEDKAMPTGAPWRGWDRKEATRLYALAKRLNWETLFGKPKEASKVKKETIPQLVSAFVADMDRLLEIHDASSPYRIAAHDVESVL